MRSNKQLMVKTYDYLITDNEALRDFSGIEDLNISVLCIRDLVSMILAKYPFIAAVPSWPPVEVFYDGYPASDRERALYTFLRETLSECGYSLSAILELEVKVHETKRHTLFSVPQHCRVVKVH